MMRQLIVFLIRKVVGVKKYQKFRFVGQRSVNEYYWFTSDSLMKMTERGYTKQSGVSLNWLLDPNCKIKKEQLVDEIFA